MERKKLQNLKAFTLIEIAIALLLLGLLSSVVGLGLKDMFRAASFQKSVRHLEYELRQCQLFALLYRSDLDVKIVYEAKDKKWKLVHQSPEKALRQFSKRSVTLEGITSMGWNERGAFPSLTIFADGSVEPLGMIRLEAGKKKAWIDLTRPLQIKRAKEYHPAYPIRLQVNKPVLPHETNKP